MVTTVIFIDRFSDPGRAVDRMCVCASVPATVGEFVTFGFKIRFKF